MLRISSLALALVLAACGPTYQNVKLVNSTDRVIEEIYIYPTGAAKPGASRGALAPNATTEVKVATGNVDVRAVSAKVRIDETTTETRTATQTLELKGPLELIFHDSTTTPAGLARPGTRGVTFRVPAPPAPPPAATDEPGDAPL